MSILQNFLVLILTCVVMGQQNCPHPNLEEFKACLNRCDVDGSACGKVHSCVISCICASGYNRMKGNCMPDKQMCDSEGILIDDMSSEPSELEVRPLQATEEPTNEVTDETTSTTLTTTTTTEAIKTTSTATDPPPKHCFNGKIWRKGNDCLENCLPKKDICPKESKWGCHCDYPTFKHDVYSMECVKVCPSG